MFGVELEGVMQNDEGRIHVFRLAVVLKVSQPLKIKIVSPSRGGTRVYLVALRGRERDVDHRQQRVDDPVLQRGALVLGNRDGASPYRCAARRIDELEIRAGAVYCLSPISRV